MFRSAQSRGINPDTATTFTREWLGEQEGNTGPQSKGNASLVTRYTFREGRLAGLSGGVATRYQKGKPRAAALIASVVVLPEVDTDDYILTNPFVFYQRKIRKLSWRFQLNVNNVFDVRSDQGNSWRWPRYTEPRHFVYTTTVMF